MALALAEPPKSHFEHTDVYLHSHMAHEHTSWQQSLGCFCSDGIVERLLELFTADRLFSTAITDGREWRNHLLKL